MKKHSASLYACMVVAAFSLLLAGCERRPLEEPQVGNALQIPIRVYWDKAEVLPKNATILFYDGNGNLYKEWQSASQRDYAEGSVALTAGEYTAVAFNELRNQINNIQMENWDKFGIFEAVGIRNLHPPYHFATHQEGTVLLRQTGILSACTTSFTVAENVGGCSPYDPENSSYNVLSDLHPTRKCARVNLVVHVNGLNNARMPAIAELRNTASGYLFATDRNALSTVATQLTVDNRSYNPGSVTDGTVSATFYTFGIPGERYPETGIKPPMFIDIAFMLIDAKQTIVEYSVDITDLLRISTDENKGITLDIQIGIGRLPDVKPVNGNSGFDTELVDWDKVIIPIQQ